MKNIILLFRPYQYVKNLFVFAPLIFAFSFNNEILIKAGVAFLFFCIAASSVYIFNDIMDVEEDRKHPSKSKRPIASNKVSIKQAYFLSFSLMIFVLIASFAYSRELFFVLLGYLILNILYCVKFKHIPIVDIFIISLGFVLRLMAGSVTTSVPLSMWIIIITFLLAVFLALAKRRDDVLLYISGRQTRMCIDGYNLEFVNAGMVLMAGVVIVGYLQYTVSPEVIHRIGNHYLYITTLFVALGVLRYMQITFVEQMSGNPSKIVLKDRFLQITILLWMTSFVGIVKFL